MRYVSLALIAATGLVSSLTSATADTAFRIATWNVETIGSIGTSQFGAAQAVIARINPDVLAIAEVASDADVAAFKSLASTLGYSFTSVAPAGPFGTLRGAIMSKYPLTGTKAWTAAQLSGDATANDLTRFILEAQIKLPNNDPPLSVITTHWKSGTADADEFRRDIETKRIRTLALQRSVDQIPFAVMGDVNENIMEGNLLSGAARSPTYFQVAPTGLPTGFKIGSDISKIMGSGGLYNNPFHDIRYISNTTPLAVLLDTKQLDGTYATRPSSQRRIDYILTAPSIVVRGKQVYDCAEDNWAGGLALYGSRVSSTTCATASDHLPVFSDITIKANLTQTATLQTQKAGTGKGTVQSLSGEINCGTSCSSGSASYRKGSLVTLTATPATGSKFSGWSGACAGTATICTVLINSNPINVSANFN